MRNTVSHVLRLLNMRSPVTYDEKKYLQSITFGKIICRIPPSYQVQGGGDGDCAGTGKAERVEVKAGEMNYKAQQIIWNIYFFQRCFCYQPDLADVVVDLANGGQASSLLFEKRFFF